jgi:hypothetical protein
MSGVAKKLMGTTAAGGGFTAIEDVFSTYLYTGDSTNPSPKVNGIDLAGEGGMVWLKSRTGAYNNYIADTEKPLSSGGGATWLYTNTTDAVLGSIGTGLMTFNSDGFSTFPTGVGVNASGNNYASWTFRKAPRFFDVVTYTGTGANRTVAHNLGVEPGCIIIKETTAIRNWYVYHRSTGNTQFLNLNTTGAAATASTAFNNTSPTDTEFTVGTVNGINNSGASYVAYLFAHDPLGPSGDGSDGLIACGSFTETASGFEVDLGWEPQFLIYKRTDGSAGWGMVDTMRGFTADRNIQYLTPNGSNAEQSLTKVGVTSTGFYSSAPIEVSGANFIYIAIRRGPMRVPESGTEVFNVEYQAGTDTRYRGYLGNPVDAWLSALPSNTAGKFMRSRLQGQGNYLDTTSTAAEAAQTDQWWDNNLGVGVTGTTYTPSTSVVNYLFRRAPNFFDVVAYTGTGNPLTLNHNLGVAPELILYKSRSAAQYWLAQSSAMTSVTDSLMLLNQNNGEITSSGFFRTPDNSTFGFAASGNLTGCNTAGVTYIAYLFATLAGVSKVGSYTGNGTTLNIDCGFTTGARFVLIKGSSFTHDWHVFDTARGIVAGNDPFLELNTTNAENASYDAVDPLSSGFTVNQTAVANLNADGASYIFYAIA